MPPSIENPVFKLFWYKVVHRKIKLLNLLVDYVLSLELTTETTQTGPGIFIAEVFLLAREIRMCLKDTIMIMEVVCLLKVCSVRPSVEPLSVS